MCDFSHINGGAGQVALTSAIGLARAGERVIVFAAVAPVMPELEQAGVEVIVTRQHEILRDPRRMRAAVQGVWNFVAQREMKQLLSRLDPTTTIIHIHSWTKALSASVMRTAMARGFQVLCTLHDYFAACPNGGLFDYQRGVICDERPMSVGCITRNCDTRSYSHKLWRVGRQAVQQFASVPDGIEHFVTVSDFSEVIMAPYLPAHATIHRVENPIDVARAPSRDAGCNQPFVFVGRLSPEKGVALLALASRRAGVDVLFVGEGDGRSEIERLNPDARITGWLGRDEVIGHIGRSRAIVSPSLCYETQGLTVMEAAAIGIPAIVADTSAATNAVDDGRTGLWFHGGDADDLVDKLRRLQDAQLARQFGAAAYERYWNAPSTINTHVASLQDCYERILISRTVKRTRSSTAGATRGMAQ